MVALLLFLFSFVIFALGISSSVYGGDSGDIILASWFGGVAHPPGYPLNTMFGWVFTHLPFEATVAFKANLMAAFLMALSISLLFLILQKLIRNFFVALSSSLILAFIPLFWLYAHILEVFQLNLVLVALSLYFLFSWRESKLLKKKKDLFLKLAFLFLGFAIFHHHTSVLIVPAYIFLILKTDRVILSDRRLFINLVLFSALGFLPYLFIPFAAVRQTPINWDDPVNVRNFIQLITRADYGTFIAASHIVGVDLKSRLIQVVNFFLFLRSDFSFIGLLLMVVGAVYTYLRQRIIFYFVLISAFLTGPFFLFYASFPLVNDFYFGLWERFVLLSYFILSIYVGFGVKFIYDNLINFSQKFKLNFLGKSSKTLLAGCLLFLIPFYLAFINYPKANLSNFVIGDWLGWDVVASAETNAIILIFNDTLTFNTQYVYYANNKPENVKLVKAGQLRHLEYRKQIMRHNSELKFPKDFLDEDESDSRVYIDSLISENINTFPIYSSDYFPDIVDYKWMTVGLLRKLVTSKSYSVDELNRANESAYGDFKYKDVRSELGYNHFMTSHIQEIYYRSLITLADEYTDNKIEKEALLYLDKATILFPDANDAYIRLGNIYIQSGKCIEAKDNFEKAFNINAKDWRLAEILSGIYGECLKDEQKAKMYSDKAREVREKSDSADKI